MTPTPRQLLELGLLAPLDVELAETLGELVGETSQAALLGVAFASHAVADGHACVDLAELSVRGLHDDEGQPLTGIALPDAASFISALRSSLLADSGDPAAGEARPLVLDARGRLYLRRYYEYEARLATALRARADAPPPALDEARLAAGLARLFPAEKTSSEPQRRAAELALRSRFTVVSGGPGTGKTYTVSKILVLVFEQALPEALLADEAKARALAPKVALLAPTGKAAQRLGDAIRQNVEALGCDPRLAALVPFETMTIHRALGYQPATPTRFRHHLEHRLPHELVVVDEASMVDLALMTKLLEAIRPDARLVLLGDKDQLASVETGAIFAEIYAGSREGGALSQHLVELVHAHRFEDEGGIGELARAVNAGDFERALDCFRRFPNLRLEPLDDAKEVEQALAPVALERFLPLFSGAPAARLAALDAFRILGCHLSGPLGVHTMNAWVEARLRATGQVEGRSEFYDGRPVIVTENDYQAALFNGDVGVVAPLSSADGGARLAVHFRSRELGATRSLSAARLPQHETAYALSVHKAQGSEFGEVALILPSRPSPILTRELVYTAVTRARRAVTIYGSEAVLKSALDKRVERASGLRDRLALK